jgi:hypothetical protein
MQHSAESNLKIEYLREYEFIFKTALAHESGDPVVSLAEKTKGRKSRETVPLKFKETTDTLSKCLFPVG